ncbi:MAG: carbon-nitrogen hydrolase family protein [Desulfosudaceae bacterium]
MKAAAIQMTATLGDVAGNLAEARRLAGQAFDRGAELVILPEFFTSAMGFDPGMRQAARPFEGEPLALLRELAGIHDGIIGGSFITSDGPDNYNTFALVFPDGRVFTHNKDQPTMWENCYYRGGADDGVLDTPLGQVGAALCWEFVRARTAARLVNRVEVVVGGSCWWSLPKKPLPGFTRRVSDRNKTIMRQTPARFARMVGCPVVHAAHAGAFKCRTPLLPGFPYESEYLGETQIVDGRGTVLARMSRSEGAGIITADITLGRVEPAEAIPERFWIPDLPVQIRLAWWYQNRHGRWYYRRWRKP